MVDPYDVRAITDAMRRIISDDVVVESLIEDGYAQVKRFTWARAAHQLRGIYAQVLADRL
jgi:glycosyltransferase involved in cell wall biosynthesis